MTANDPGNEPRDSAGLVAHFFRHQSGRLIACLVRRHGAARLELIEDAVQAALAQALAVWARRGVPDNPSAWLTRVAQNQLIDQLRRERTAQSAVAADGEAHSRAVVEGAVVVGDAQAGDAEVAALPATVAFVQEIADDELRMLFVCCDDKLPARAQLVLSLRLLCGFSTREIATRLFITDGNVQKILTRGRARLRELWDRTPEEDWTAPPSGQLPERLTAVQHVIYLLFNEGYSSQQDGAPMRRDLCAEALRLGELLVAHPVGDTAESWALLALLQFHTARLDARTDSDGSLLLLEEQDRSRWHATHIRRGLECLWRSGRGERFSRYHAEAAVLAEHCIAPNFERTRWGEIVDLYAMLELREPSPLHTLNRAIALGEWKGPQAAVALLEEMAPPNWLTAYYLWDATFGELLRRAGDFARATAYLERAVQRCPTSGERRVFEKRLERCRNGDQSR